MEAFRLNTVPCNFFGLGALSLLPEELQKRGFKRALIVTDLFLYENGTVAQVAHFLEQGGAQFGVYNKVQPNPTIASVEECKEYAKGIDADCLVAVGGGSAIDAAKAVGILLANGGNVQQYEGVGKSKNPSIPLIVINTTAGTGSEMTNFYIITDEKRRVKLCMVDNNCLPSITVNDASLMVSMPPSLTAATGMDALTHSIEAVLSKQSNPLSDKDALWAISTVYQYLPVAYADGNNIQARNYMAYAASIAGVAFANSGLGIVHAMAHSLGGFYNLPHGICNAVLLPWAMEFNATCEKNTPNFRKIAVALGVENVDEKHLVENTIAAVRKLSKSLLIPARLRELGGVNPEDFEALASLAMQDACMLQNSFMPTYEQVVQLYKKAY